jgi:DNA polymerase-4
MDRFFEPLQWTINLRQEIMETTGLPISFGLASGKMVAKMATNAAKPNGYLQVLPGCEQDFLGPLPVGEIPGVGEHMLKNLNALGIIKISDLAAFPVQLLEKYFGKYGEILAQKATGAYAGTIHTTHESKSISTEHTFFENTADQDYLQAELLRMTEKLGFELREEQKMTRCVAVKIRYPDFSTHTKQVAIKSTSYDDEIIRIVRDLFRQLYDGKQQVRLIGVRFSDLTAASVQTDIFENRVKKANLYAAIDGVKNRFGKGKLARGKG